MSDWPEYDPFDDAMDGDGEPATDSAVAGGDQLDGIDVAAIAAQLVAPAIEKAIGREIDAIAAEAIAAALTPDVLDQLRSEAVEAAETVLHSGPQNAANDAPALYFGSTDEFVREYLIHVYKRRIDGRTAFWSPRWWAFAEAVARLEALWRAWEHLRLDPATGPSVWWRDHADPHMRALMDITGPFSKENKVTTTVLDPLPYEAPPEGLFPDVRDVSPGTAE